MIDDPILLNDWHAVAWSADLQAGQAKPVRLLEEDLVIWRNADGVHVWQDLCVHRGSKLSIGRVAKECLICPYHGWEYNSAGECVRIPAHPNQLPPTRARVKTYSAREQYDLVWVCLGEPRQDIPCFPEWADASFAKIPAGPYTYHAHGPRVIENFLDVAHFPFVHMGYLGDPSQTEIGDYEARIFENGVVTDEIPVWQPDPDGTGKAAQVSYTFHVPRPLMALFVKAHGPNRFAMFSCVTPVAERESTIWLIMALNYASDFHAEDLRRFQDAVTAQDIPVVESQRPELLPLDLQAELHLRSDRAAIAYRQWLKKIGLRYGTA